MVPTSFSLSDELPFRNFNIVINDSEIPCMTARYTIIPFFRREILCYTIFLSIFLKHFNVHFLSEVKTD